MQQNALDMAQRRQLVVGVLAVRLDLRAGGISGLSALISHSQADTACRIRAWIVNSTMPKANSVATMTCTEVCGAMNAMILVRKTAQRNE
jgi:hypothetical protein